MSADRRVSQGSLDSSGYHQFRRLAGFFRVLFRNARKPSIDRRCLRCFRMLFSHA